jgi:hypothetical protein
MQKRRLAQILIAAMNALRSLLREDQIDGLLLPA